jgi:hypothetical protein
MNSVQSLIDQHFNALEGGAAVLDAEKTAQADGAPQDLDMIESGVQMAQMLKEASVTLEATLQADVDAQQVAEGGDEIAEELERKLAMSDTEVGPNPGGGETADRMTSSEQPDWPGAGNELRTNEKVMDMTRRDAKRHQVSPLQAVFGHGPAKEPTVRAAFKTTTPEKGGLKYASPAEELRNLLED